METPSPIPPDVPPPISQPESPAVKPRLEGWCYVIGFCSLIPIAGLLAVIASLILGFLKIRKGGWLLILLAVLGLGVSGGSAYTYFKIFKNQAGPTVDPIQKATVDDLTRLASEIEDYKAKNGKYPESLTDLPAEAGKNPHIFDLAAMRGQAVNPKESPLYVYEIQPGGQTYYLFSRGFDGKAYTPDDLFPRIDPSPAAAGGYQQRPLNPFFSTPTPDDSTPEPDNWMPSPTDTPDEDSPSPSPQTALETPSPSITNSITPSAPGASPSSTPTEVAAPTSRTPANPGSLNQASLTPTPVSTAAGPSLSACPTPTPTFYL